MSGEDGEAVSSSVLYADDPEWKDITPIYPSAEEEIVVRIVVSKQFRDAFGYFRAILLKKELSPRAFRLTEDCIQLNPANYTLWQYRRDIIKALDVNLKTELRYLDEIISENPKNYQVWHHRRIIAEWMGAECVESELAFSEHILDDESKNYHAWQHRQWVIKTWTEKSNVEAELSFALKLLMIDPRNNSAWNYRYYLLSIHNLINNADYSDIEINLCKQLIEKMPNNESVWNYLTGLLLENGINSNETVVKFVEDLYERTDKAARAPHLVSFLCDILLEKLENGTDAQQNCTRVTELYNELIVSDPVRQNYWKHQQKLAENLLQKAK